MPTRQSASQEEKTLRKDEAEVLIEGRQRILSQLHSMEQMGNESYDIDDSFRLSVSKFFQLAGFVF